MSNLDCGHAGSVTGVGAGRMAFSRGSVSRGSVSRGSAEPRWSRGVSIAFLAGSSLMLWALIAVAIGLVA